ncbi:MAG: DUF6922 domain-containing protein [Halothiobacillaceae bacterium]
MSVLIRTIGNRQYAYTVHRDGERTVQTYLGPMARADVAARVAALRKEGSIPSQFHRFFWDIDPSAIDLHRHEAYVIARILDVGSLRAVWWLQLQYPTRAILQVLASNRAISARSQRFWSAWFEVNRAS